MADREQLKYAKERAKAIVDIAKGNAKADVDAAKAKASIMIDKAKAKAEKVIDIAKARKQKGSGKGSDVTGVVETLNNVSLTDTVVDRTLLLPTEVLTHVARNISDRRDALNWAKASKTARASVISSIVDVGRSRFRPSLKSLTSACVCKVQYRNAPNEVATLTLGIKGPPNPRNLPIMTDDDYHTVRNIVFNDSSANGLVVRNVDRGGLWESFLKEPPFKKLRDRDDGIDFSNPSKYMANVERLPKLMELLGKITDKYAEVEGDVRLDDNATYYRTSDFDVTNNTLFFGERHLLGVMFVQWRKASSAMGASTLNIHMYAPDNVHKIEWDITIVFNATEVVVIKFLRDVSVRSKKIQFERMLEIVPVDLIIGIVENCENGNLLRGLLNKLFKSLIGKTQ